MIELLIIFTGLYFLITIIIHFGLSVRDKIIDQQPTVSILVAARNEENNLPACLESLENLNYPVDKMEILIINDRSEDNTKNIALNYGKKNSHFQLLDIENDIRGLKGKIHALCQGIEKTSGEIILITDADCIVPSNWVDSFVRYFDDDVGMCGGMTLLSKPKQKEKFFNRLQALDWIYLQSIAAGSCQVGFPVSILGNNFAFRRSAYQDVGGFRQLGFSVTEDMKLLQAIHQTKKWKIKYPLQNDTAIYSKPVDSIMQFYSQRKRWVLGGKKSHWWGFVIMSVSFITHLIALCAVFPGYWVVPVFVALSLLFAADFSLIIRMLRRFKRDYLWLYIFPFEIYYTLYSIVFALVYFTGSNVKWKNRDFET